MRFLKNNNNAIIKKLTRKTIKANKLRNIIAIIAIALTTLLFTSIFTIGLGIKNSFEQETMRQVGGYSHATFKYITKDQLNKIKTHPSIKEFGYSIMVSMGENKEFLKRHTEIRYGTDQQAKMFFSYPTTGRMPEKENELVADTKVLDLLGIPHEIGKTLKLEYKIEDEKRSKEFVISGFFESDEASNSSTIWVSKLFIDKELADIEIGNKNLNSDTGEIFLDVMFKNSIDIEGKVNTVLKDSGYSNEQDSPNFIGTGVNWAYVSTNSNSDLVIPIFGACMLIILTGYLIIYNIFQIYVIKDIRSYGLLKTIGTTSKQIKKLIRNQAFLLSFIGIPLGLIIGFVIGNILLPVIMSTLTFKTAYISFNPIIFIGATLFSLITVYISCKKPGKIAASVSPVEATKYTEVSMKNKNNIKKSIDGTKIYKMALYNIQRNKKKTIIVIISMSLSLILLNSIYTFTKGFDMDKYLSKRVVSDFLVGHAKYFNFDFKSQDEVVSENLINNINKLDYIDDKGRIYLYLGEDKDDSIIKFDNSKRIANLYGLDDFPIYQLKVVEGNIDLEKLKSGKYILEAIDTDDNGNLRYESAPCNVGQKVTLNLQNNKIKEYEVMAKVEMKYPMSVRYSTNDENGMGDIGIILPANEFCNVVENPLTMNYMFNVHDNKLYEAEKFIKNYTENIEDNMNYESKQVYVDQFKGLKNMFLLVGGTLSIVIGVIGMLNFINAIITSIISRQREFAMLQSIGMTTKQLKSMLVYEGGFYAVATILVSAILGSSISLGVVSPILKVYGSVNITL